MPATPINSYRQAWSKCVDRERDAGSDFTEECREKVGGRVVGWVELGPHVWRRWM